MMSSSTKKGILASERQQIPDGHYSMSADIVPSERCRGGLLPSWFHPQEGGERKKHSLFINSEPSTSSLQWTIATAALILSVVVRVLVVVVVCEVEPSARRSTTSLWNLHRPRAMAHNVEHWFANAQLTPIVVGAVNSINSSSSYAPEGAFHVASGVAAAFMEFNEAGGWLGRNISYVVLVDDFNVGSELVINQSLALLLGVKPVAVLSPGFATSPVFMQLPLILNPSNPTPVFDPVTVLPSAFSASVPHMAHLRASFDSGLLHMIHFGMSSRYHCARFAFIYYPFGGVGELAERGRDAVQALGLPNVTMRPLTGAENATELVESTLNQTLEQDRPQCILILHEPSSTAFFAASLAMHRNWRTSSMIVIASSVSQFASYKDNPLILAGVPVSAFANLFFVQQFPSPTDTSSVIVKRYQSALTRYYTTMANAPSLVSYIRTPGEVAPISYDTLNGYIAGRWFIDILGKANGNTSGKALLDAVYNYGGSFALDDLLLGNYRRACVSGLDAAQASCFCNSGLRRYWMSRVNGSTGKVESFVDSAADGDFNAAERTLSTTTCDIQKTDLSFPYMFDELVDVATDRRTSAATLEMYRMYHQGIATAIASINKRDVFLSSDIALSQAKMNTTELIAKSRGSAAASSSSTSFNATAASISLRQSIAGRSSLGFVNANIAQWLSIFKSVLGANIPLFDLPDQGLRLTNEATTPFANFSSNVLIFEPSLADLSLAAANWAGVYLPKWRLKDFTPSSGSTSQSLVLPAKPKVVILGESEKHVKIGVQACNTFQFSPDLTFQWFPPGYVDPNSVEQVDSDLAARAANGPGVNSTSSSSSPSAISFDAAARLEQLKLDIPYNSVVIVIGQAFSLLEQMQAFYRYRRLFELGFATTVVFVTSDYQMYHSLDVESLRTAHPTINREREGMYVVSPFPSLRRNDQVHPFLAYGDTLAQTLYQLLQDAAPGIKLTGTEFLDIAYSGKVVVVDGCKIGPFSRENCGLTAPTLNRPEGNCQCNHAFHSFFIRNLLFDAQWKMRLGGNVTNDTLALFDGTPTDWLATTQQEANYSYTLPSCSARFIPLPVPEDLTGDIAAGVAAVVILLAIICTVACCCRPKTRNNKFAPKDSSTPFTIMFTDIQSSTTLWARAPEDMANGVETHHELIRDLIHKYNGYEVKTIGDSFMVAFRDPMKAVECANELQMVFFCHDWKTTVFDDIYHELELEKMKEAEQQAHESNSRSDSASKTDGETTSSGGTNPNAASSSTAPAVHPPPALQLTSPTKPSSHIHHHSNNAAAVNMNSFNATEYNHDVWHGIRVRVGLHFGLGSVKYDAVTLGYDYYGTVVNTAARVEGVGNGGQVLMTDALHMVVKDLPQYGVELTESVTELDMGPQPLRGLDDGVRLWQLQPKALNSRKFAPLRLDVEREVDADDEGDGDDGNMSQRSKSSVGSVGGAGTEKLDWQTVFIRKQAKKLRPHPLFPGISVDTLVSLVCQATRTLLSTLPTSTKHSTAKALAQAWHITAPSKEAFKSRYEELLVKISCKSYATQLALVKGKALIAASGGQQMAADGLWCVPPLDSGRGGRASSDGMMPMTPTSPVGRQPTADSLGTPTTSNGATTTATARPSAFDDVNQTSLPPTATGGNELRGADSTSPPVTPQHPHQP